jgi:hypothetical protein
VQCEVNCEVISDLTSSLLLLADMSDPSIPLVVDNGTGVSEIIQTVSKADDNSCGDT